MMLRLLPSRTKKLPMMEVTTQTAADRQRQDHHHIHIGLPPEEDGGQHHGRHRRHSIGFEQVGGHAGAVPDIVADVIGYGRGVSGIVLGGCPPRPCPPCRRPRRRPW